MAEHFLAARVAGQCREKKMAPLLWTNHWNTVGCATLTGEDRARPLPTKERDKFRAGAMHPAPAFLNPAPSTEIQPPL